MNLGTWLNTQRQLYRVEKLDPSKQATLEGIGVTWNAREWKWDEMMGLLVEYKDREGDCMVPQNHKERGENLGKWVDTQRHLQRNGGLDDSRKAKLEELGMIWDVSAFHQKEMMISLRQYKKRIQQLSQGELLATQATLSAIKAMQATVAIAVT